MMSYNPNPLSKWLIDQPRRHIYAGAVISIEAYAETTMISRELEQQLKDPEKWASERERLEGMEYVLNRYREDLVTVLVPHLQRDFPSLRFIYLGASREPFKGDSYVVRLNPSPLSDIVDTSSPPVDNPPIIGHIIINQFLLAYIHKDPLKTPLVSHYASFGGFTVENRFDLDVHSERKPPRRRSHMPAPPPPLPKLSKEWETALREESRYTALNAIDTGDIEVSLDTFACIYRRQAEQGVKERLRTIIAPNISAWKMNNLWDFASVACSHLTTLHLLGEHRHQSLAREKREKRELIGFDVLPELIRLIRDGLTNLKTLEVEMSYGEGDETSEGVCRDFLSRDILEKRGNLTKLFIYTQQRPFPTPFNTLRAVSPLLASNFAISVGNSWYHHTNEDQVSFLKRMRA